MLAPRILVGLFLGAWADPTALLRAPDPAVQERPQEDRALDRLGTSLRVVREALGEGGGGVEAARVELTRAADELPPAEEMEGGAWKQRLAELDDLALELALLPCQLAARERSVALEERGVPADHTELLEAKRRLALTRYQLGDLRGAHELFVLVHAERERSLPPDHPDLLAVTLNLAVTRHQLGDPRGALVLFEHVHAAWERLLPPDHPDLLRARGNLAAARKEQGDLRGALELEELVHAARERLLPPDHPDLLTAKLNLAATRYELGDLQEALELEELVHAARERLLPPDHPDLLAAKQNLAATRYQLGDLQGALALREHVHSARERLLPPDHPDLLTAKQDLAMTLGALGDLQGALELEEYVHAARERLLPPDHPDLLDAKHNLAATRFRLGDVRGALEFLEYVLAERERQLSADHPSLLAAKSGVAAARQELGDLWGALELEESVLASRERLLPPDHPGLLAARQNLASTYFQLGDLRRALELYESVLAARERLLPPDHPDLLSAKQGLATTRRALGDARGALELLESVLAARERVLPPDHPDLLSAKQGLAMTRKELGDLGGALELFELVHAAYERLLPVDHATLLAAKLNMAVTLRALGEPRRALELEELVHAARRRLLPPDHPGLLSAKMNLAVTRRQLGDLEGALELLEYVHAARRRLLPPDHPSLFAATLNLAATRKELGDRQGTIELLRSLTGDLLVHAAAMREDSPRSAREAALTGLDRISCALSLSEHGLADGQDGLEGQLFSVLESLRLVSTSSSGIALALARFPELIAVRDRLADVRSELNALSLAPREDAPVVEAWRKEVFELAEERDRLERALRAKLSKERVLAALPTSDSVARNLDEGAALVSFFRYSRYLARNAEAREYPPPVDSLLAFVVTPDGTVKRVELGPSVAIEELVSRWRAQLGKPIERGALVTEEKESEGDIGTSLRARILDPCLAALGGELPQKLHVITDDFLHLLPMDALPWKDGRRLGELLPIYVEVSTERLTAPSPRVAAHGILLALGGVDFGADDVAVPRPRIPVATPPAGDSFARSASPRKFADLLFSSFEVEALGKLYAEVHESEPVVLKKGEATKKALHELAPQARYLHVATHGWFAPETFKSMRDPGEQQDELRAMLERAEDTVLGFAPETLCGLALAGANHGRNELGQVPGILTAEELATIDLSSCELVVLSACETNVGIHRAGQGIQSLQSALHAAGARTAVTSLWRVSDSATQRLMVIFYTGLWRGGLGKADALWQAKMALRDEGFSLQDWAAWVLSGDPE